MARGEAGKGRAVTAAAQVGEQIRALVLAGRLMPGTRLDEISLGAEYGVSRNTLREAFRILAQDMVVEHIPHRGVFVRTIGRDEAHDIYATRRMLQVGALRQAALAPAKAAPGLARVERAVVAAEAARASRDWEGVGTANGDFHRALAALAGNVVVDRILDRLMAEMRLIFLSLGAARDVHDQFVPRNRELHELVRLGEYPRAAVALEVYLLESEAHVLGGRLTTDGHFA